MKAKFVYDIMRNEQTKYCVFRYRFLDTNKTVTCIGTDLPMGKITYDLEVEEINNPQYGKQYKVLSYEECVGDNKEDIIEYISMSYKGIGKKSAEKIYRVFEKESIDIIENTPEKLLQIPGITVKKVEAIKEACKEKKANKDLYMFLMPFDFSMKTIKKITEVFHFYGDILERIKENPYMLCDVKGIDFKKADQLKEACNIKAGDKQRVLAACVQAIKYSMVEGNVGINKETLLSLTYKLLSLKSSYEGCKRHLWNYIVQFIKEEQLSYRKVFDGESIVQYIYLKYMEDAEKELASNIVRLLRSQCEPVPNIDELIDKYARKFNITYDESQKNAIRTIFDCYQLIILTGGPGSGKTTTINTVAAIYEDIYPINSQEFMAPTGRAARKISESTGELASTIHSRFSLRIHEETAGAYEEEEEPITEGLVVVDEFSMVDMMLALKLFRNIQGNVKIVIVGDPDQLSSVGPGNVLGDMIDSGAIPVVRLQYAHRQGEEAAVINENAENMKKNITVLKEAPEFVCHYMEDEDSTRYLGPTELLQEIENGMVADYLQNIKEHPEQSIVCLCPYKKYPAGVDSVNQRIQEAVNPLNGRAEMKGYNGVSFRVNDPVMHLKNEEETLNGDLGIVTYVGQRDIHDKTMVMIATYDTLEGKVDVEYTQDNIDEVTLAYAMTVHKSQGSEYDVVITCLTDFHKKMLYRNILYTDITRGKKKVILRSERSTIATAIQNKSMKKRNTLLAYNIRNLYEQKVTQMKLSI